MTSSKRPTSKSLLYVSESANDELMNVLWLTDLRNMEPEKCLVQIVVMSLTSHYFARGTLLFGSIILILLLQHYYHCDVFNKAAKLIY